MRLLDGGKNITRAQASQALDDLTGRIGTVRSMAGKDRLCFWEFSRDRECAGSLVPTPVSRSADEYACAESP